MTTTGMLHTIFGFVGLMLLPFAALFINLSLVYKNEEWQPVRRVILLTGILPIVGLIGFWVHMSIYVFPLGEDAYGPEVP